MRQDKGFVGVECWVFGSDESLVEVVGLNFGLGEGDKT